MNKYFQPSATARILVVGDVILDRYVQGEVTRISPEAPVPIVKVNSTEDKPGGAANVALNLKSLGIKVRLLGITGDDIAADVLSDQLGKADIQFKFVRQKSFRTVTKLRVMGQHQQLLRLDYEPEPVAADSEALYSLFSRVLKDIDVVILSDYAKGSLQEVTKFINLARTKDIPVLVDPKGNDFKRYFNANILSPNLLEFETIAGHCKDDAELVDRGQSLCESLNLDAICITRGECGITLIHPKKNNVVQLPAKSHEVFDVTGAGDTVIATLAAALVSGYELEQALVFANHAAGMVVKKLGTATVSVNELNVELGNVNAMGARIIEQDMLPDLLAAARDKGKKVVMTNGCFDILHTGHVYFLTEAKALGDYLLVAVNDDESVKRLKGKHRPLHTIQQRIEVLAGLAVVDWVITFSEDTPEALIEFVKPDLLVKGGDYQISQIAGAETVLNNGGEVRTIPFRDSNSTSKIIRSIHTNMS